MTTTKPSSKSSPSTTSSTPKVSHSTREPPASKGSIIIDILRAIVGLALITATSSYLLTGGASYTWGLKERPPWWANVRSLSRLWNGPFRLTNSQLAAYDGSDPSKPILLAINRTIYDVSASPHVYGPGGMYSTLAAKDASRSYITTCFDPAEDLVPWLGGVEEVYVPLWLSRRAGDAELEAVLGGGAATAAGVGGGKTGKEVVEDVRRRIGARSVRRLQEEAYEAARGRVATQISTWEGMFRRKGYPVVGKVVGVDEADEALWKGLGFCEAATKQRPDMTESLVKAMGLAKGGGKGEDAAKGKLDLGQKGGAPGANPHKGHAHGAKGHDNGHDKAHARMEDVLGGKYDKKHGGVGSKEL